MTPYYIRWALLPRNNEALLESEEIRQSACIGRAHWAARLRHIPDSVPYKRPIMGYIKHMHDIYEPEGVGLILHGPCGSGKTALGCIVLRNVLGREGRALFIRAEDAINGLLSKYRVDLPNGIPLIEALKGVHYLMLDDVEPQEYGVRQKQVETILRWRDNEDRPTIITTNLEKDEMAAPDLTWLQSMTDQRFVEISIPLPPEGVDWRSNPPTQ